MSCYTREQIEEAMKAKGFKYFTGGDYDVNIIGVRNSETKNRVTNAFDDCVTISYKVEGEWNFHCFKATTDPGSHWERNLLNEDGVAILVPGQYRGSHTIGLHQGKYEALKQKANVKVYRDANKDMTYDESKITEGVYGINIHKAGADSTFVENLSEGCQVFKREKDFNQFMEIMRQARGVHGNSFTYTLIESGDFLAADKAAGEAKKAAKAAKAKK